MAGQAEVYPASTRGVRLCWPAILERAAEIVRSYDTSVTLRQLHYRLVSEQLIPNTRIAYQTLSDRTATARREGWFPALMDRTRAISRPSAWDSPGDAMASLVAQYRRDRTEGQQVALYMGVEKAGLVTQLESWFSDRSIPILALGGYSSQSFVDEVREDASEREVPAVLLYAGDHDPSGHDIPRDFIERCSCFTEVERVALSPDQVQQYQLPPAMGKATDSRAESFVRRFGELVQVELDALPPDVLHQLYEDALAEWWDDGACRTVLAAEDADRSALSLAARSVQ